MNAIGIKGVGEIGVTGSAGAIANAIWHTTGIRVRRFPITLDQLIAAMLRIDRARPCAQFRSLWRFSSGDITEAYRTAP